MLNNDNIFVQKLISDLKDLDIIFTETDPETTFIKNFNGKNISIRNLDNVIFQKDNKILKIYKGLFYRESGLCAAYEISSKTTCKPIIISDEIFYDLQKTIIINTLNLSEVK